MKPFLIVISALTIAVIASFAATGARAETRISTIEQAFLDQDTNRDRHLSESEFDHDWAAQWGLDADLMDLDGDQRVTLAEAVEAISFIESDWGGLAGRAGTD